MRPCIKSSIKFFYSSIPINPIFKSLPISIVSEIVRRKTDTSKQILSGGVYKLIKSLKERKSKMFTKPMPFSLRNLKNKKSFTIQQHCTSSVNLMWCVRWCQSLSIVYKFSLPNKVFSLLLHTIFYIRGKAGCIMCKCTLIRKLKKFYLHVEF